MKANRSGKSVIFPVPLKLNAKVIEFCKNDKINVTVKYLDTAINFIVKASRFGSKKTGDRRIFKVPSELREEITEMCKDNTVKVILQKIKPS